MAALDPKAWCWREFPDRAALAAELSAEVARCLTYTIHDDGEAVLAVSGGTTPKAFFSELSRTDIEWDSVIVTLCDERFAPPSSPRSNEALVRTELMRNRAKDARFVPLFQNVASVEEAAAISNDVLNELPQPAAVAVLGMGLDGHTASFFPDSPELASALDFSSMAEVIAIHSPSAGEPRLTQTLQALATAWNVFLHIEGDSKRRAFEGAMQDEPALPVRTLIATAYAESGVPVNVFWAP